MSMVLEAIFNTHDYQGVSRAAIANYIKAHFNPAATGARFNTALRNALSNGIEEGVLIQGNSNQRFKLSDSAQRTAEKNKAKKDKQLEQAEKDVEKELLDKWKIDNAFECSGQSLREKYGKLVLLQTQLALLEETEDLIELFGPFMKKQSTTVSDLRRIVYRILVKNLSRIPASEIVSLTHQTQKINERRRTQSVTTPEKACLQGHISHIPSDLLSSILEYLCEEDRIRQEFVNRTFMLASKDATTRLLGRLENIGRKEERVLSKILKNLSVLSCPVGLMLKYRFSLYLGLHESHVRSLEERRDARQRKAPVTQMKCLFGVFSKLKYLSLIGGLCDRNKLLDFVVKHPVTIPSLETFEFDLNMWGRTLPDFKRVLKKNPQIKKLIIHAEFAGGSHKPSTTKPKFWTLLKQTLHEHKNITAFAFYRFNRGRGSRDDPNFFKLPGAAKLDISHIESLAFHCSCVWTHLFHPQLRKLTLRSPMPWDPVNNDIHLSRKLVSLEYLRVSSVQLIFIHSFLPRHVRLRSLLISHLTIQDFTLAHDVMEPITRVIRNTSNVKIEWSSGNTRQLTSKLASMARSTNSNIVFQVNFPIDVTVERRDHRFPFVRREVRKDTDSEEAVKFIRSLSRSIAPTNTNGNVGRRIIFTFDRKRPWGGNLTRILKQKKRKGWWNKWKEAERLDKFPEFGLTFGFELSTET